MGTYVDWIFWSLAILGALVGLYVLTMAILYIWIGRKLVRIFKDEQFSWIFEENEKSKPPDNN